MSTIKNIKSVYYLEETETNEVYDSTKQFQEIKSSEITFAVRDDVFETAILNKNRELAPLKYTGRTKGNLTIVKNLDSGLVAHHSGLIDAGLGEITAGGVAQDLTVTSFGAAISVTVASSVEVLTWGVGTLLRLTSLTAKSRVFCIKSITPAGGDFIIVLKGSETGNSLLEQELFTLNPTKAERVETINIGKPVQGKTFCVVTVFSDSTVEVLRGCGVSFNIELNTDSGQAKVTINFHGAISENINEFTKALHTAPADIVLEPNYRPIAFDFLDSFIDNSRIFPQQIALSINHTCEENNIVGGGNNVLGYYTRPEVSVEGKFHRSSSAITLFNRFNEATERVFFMSQVSFALYFGSAFFTNEKVGDHNVYDSISLAVNVNSSETKPPLMVIS